ncbi:hypothetical protein H9L39_02953 [Fusarium oxysporum f. sp. albedinis]|nr:hypothetical protein H9L39_02953 [Fusarium oxysporum f. sp. albedinis]
MCDISPVEHRQTHSYDSAIWFLHWDGKYVGWMNTMIIGMICNWRDHSTAIDTNACGVKVLLRNAWQFLRKTGYQ